MVDFVQLIQTYPKTSIILIATAISLISLIITKYMTDQKRMKELKERQKELTKLSKEVKNDMKKFSEINGEIMKISMEMMKHSFKPLLITLIPLLLLFVWIRSIYDPILSSWIWYYIGAGIISSLILRKLLKVV